MRSIETEGAPEGRKLRSPRQPRPQTCEGPVRCRDRPFHCRTAQRSRNPLRLRASPYGGPDHGFHLRMKTMRHWVTSFQLFAQGLEYGRGLRESQTSQ